MNKSFTLATTAVLIGIIATAPRAKAQIQSQGQGAPLNQPAPQGEENDSTLELTPQPGIAPQKPHVDEIPAERSYRPDSDSASVNREYRPDTENGDSTRGARHGRPYLGIEVQYAEVCLLGQEEHGLQITRIDPNSPAWAAGLQSGQPITATGAAGATLGAMIPLVNPLLNHFLEKSGSLGMGGDLIVAVDDQRVRTQDDLQNKMAQLKPGDTMYLTVIRPIAGGQHTTLKVAVHVGEVGQPLANAAPPPSEAAAH